MTALTNFITFLYIISCVFSAKDVYPPRFQSKNLNDHGFPEFHGTIREDERKVQLAEPLRVTDDDEGEGGLVCGYIIHHQKDKGIPFVVDVTNSKTGEADIRLRDEETLDYEHRLKYKFAISAFNCGSNPKTSDKAIIHIHVEDINEFDPVFDQYNYDIELEEGHIHKNFLTLKATDQDKSPELGTICGYRVVKGKDHFVVSANGELSTSVPLDHSINHHVVEVIAVDCGQLESEMPVTINVKVVKKCVPGWSGIPDKLEYTPGGGFLKFASNANLNVCDKQCPIDSISVDLSLSTQHIGKGCDRDTFTMHSQRKLCGGNTESKELLPSADAPESWTKSLMHDDGHDSDLMFAFDGHMDAVEVPPSAVDHKLKHKFSISTWMRHDREQITQNEDVTHNIKVGGKEHILCMSDSENMNRHHYSWFLHGNKMIFLLRREADDATDKESFRPAEWRWNLDTINDNKWHHYAISVKFPKVELYVDGELTDKDETKREVVEDWPLHATHKVKDTKLVVGACWQGGSKKMDMFFKGYLAGLYVLNGEVESDQIINCLTNCKEYLEFESLQKQTTGMTVSFSRDQTRLTINGETVSEVVELIREVNYQNTRGFPTPGRRNINIDTTITCLSSPEASTPVPAPIIPRFSTYILVLQAQIPVITLSEDRDVAYSIENLSKGRQPFEYISISVKLSGQDTETTPVGGPSDFLLDKCSISAEPLLNLEVERLTFPRDDMKVAGSAVIEAVETNDGVTLNGPTTTEQFQKVIRGMTYFHTDAGKLNTRKFVIMCESQNQRFVSNKILIEISAIHVQHNPEYKAHLQVHRDQIDVVAKKSAPSMKAVTNTTPSFGMIAIIVVCVGFLLFVIVLGIFRIRSYQKRTTVVHVDEKQEMEWDDSPLNIIVNPMEQELTHYNEESLLKPQVEVSDSDDMEYDDEDDDSSFHDDDDDDDGEGCDSSEDDVSNKQVKELSWDDSTLSF